MNKRKRKQLPTADDMRFLSPETFSMEIEKTYREQKGSLTYLEIVVSFCEDNDIEFESIVPIINKCPLREKIRVEAMNQGYMRQEGVLPI